MNKHKIKFRIYFTINGCKDHFDIQGNDIEECRQKAATETNKRGLNSVDNNIYSAEIIPPKVHIGF